MKASLRPEAAEWPQWPRLYLLSRPRSHGHMPSLVGDWPDAWSAGLGFNWNAQFIVGATLSYPKELNGGCVEPSRELFSDIRGRGGASNACFNS